MNGYAYNGLPTLRKFRFFAFSKILFIVDYYYYVDYLILDNLHIGSDHFLREYLVDKNDTGQNTICGF